MFLIFSFIFIEITCLNLIQPIYAQNSDMISIISDHSLPDSILYSNYILYNAPKLQPIIKKKSSHNHPHGKIKPSRRHHHPSPGHKTPRPGHPGRKSPHFRKRSSNLHLHLQHPSRLLHKRRREHPQKVPGVLLPLQARRRDREEN